MAEQPWSGDATSLVDAFRRGDHSPVAELEATLAAIEATDLNCFSYVAAEQAMDAARRADVTQPFGGLPVGVKELEFVEGWPATEASLLFKDRVSNHTSTQVQRLVDRGGAVPVGLTTASEFGGLNVSVTKLNGVTRNPWRRDRTVGGSSGGSAAAVAGGILTLATGGDGGGSIRIPAGYTGLVGMKGTYGRIPRGPHAAYFRPGTIVLGCLARSVRDVARYYDVCAGYDAHDPSSLPNPGNWEGALSSHDLRGRKVAIVPNIGGVTLEAGVEEQLRAQAKQLIDATGMVEVDLTIDVPNLSVLWMMGNLSTLLADLGPLWPKCAADLTDEISGGLLMAQSLYNLRGAAVGEAQRLEAYAAMANAFEQVDFVIAASNPGPAFLAEQTISASEGGFIEWMRTNKASMYAFRGAMVGVRMTAGAFPKLPTSLAAWATEKFPDLTAMGALTIISNVYGNPAVSIPGAVLDGLPIGMQVLARHHEDGLLFDLARAAEQAMPWPLTAP